MAKQITEHRYCRPLRANRRQRRREAQLDLKVLAALSLLLLLPLSAAGEPSREQALCADCPRMAVVPSGSFLMGSPSGEELRFDDEGPVHKVTIAQPFAVGIHEVTFDEWDACVAAGGCNGYRPDDEDWGRGSRPVINISWEDAQAYVTWLSQRIGQPYRLLNEAEWEYVARAGTTTPFSFGATISTDLANYDGSVAYGVGRKGGFREQTIAVGTFPPNGFGCSTYTATCGSGCRTVGMTGTRAHRTTVAHGRAETAAGAWYAAALGTSIQSICARRLAVGTRPTAATTVSASASL